jgi:hypothetical protein
MNQNCPFKNISKTCMWKKREYPIWTGSRIGSGSIKLIYKSKSRFRSVELIYKSGFSAR